ncbi:hypothetical protein [Streptomyces clavuligerus]|nr:hypothetical protein [Streptomyces clavuligerus]EDY48848.1 hypothetical protein SSCG_01876 [Streptomyces clavuligerus]MBY6307545.1 hypothetical protein [Streptomyces clavuligerus]WDN56605.1 hypothetical protein LL058_32810 [Streptomyces clavuligerus]
MLAANMDVTRHTSLHSARKTARTGPAALTTFASKSASVTFTTVLMGITPSR